MREVVAGEALEVRLESETEPAILAVIATDGSDGADAESAVDQVAEISLKWNDRHAARLEVRCGDRNILGDKVLVLEPMAVDETIHPNNKNLR